MRDKIEFHMRFALNYVVAFGCAILAAMVIYALTGSQNGFALQLFGFTLAFVFARRKFRPYLEHIIFQSNRVILDRFLLSVLVISAIAAALAFGIDRLFLPQLENMKIYQPDWVGARRYIVLTASYFIIAMILTELVAQSMIRAGHLVIKTVPTEQEADQPILPTKVPNRVIGLLMELPSDQREILVRGAHSNGLPLITLRGSENDQLWELLARYGWIKPTKLPRTIARQIPRGQKKKSFSAWTVTAKGSEMLADLRHLEPRANLRVVNG